MMPNNAQKDTLSDIFPEDESHIKEPEENYLLVLGTFVASLLLHGLLIAAFIFFPGNSSSRDYTPSVINVSMVSLPSESQFTTTMDSGIKASDDTQDMGDGEEQDTEIPLVTEEDVAIIENDKPAVEKPEKPEPVIARPENQVSIENKKKPEKKIKPDKKPVRVKKPKFITKKPKKLREKALKPEDISSESIKDAIRKMRAKVEKENKGKKGGSSSGGTNGGSSGQTGTINDIYKAQIYYQIKKNWAFSEYMARGRKNLRTIIRIRILPSGHIDDMEFTKRSGSKVLDDSAYRAIEKSNPLPPLPSGFREYIVELEFTPKGLN